MLNTEMTLSCWREIDGFKWTKNKSEWNCM